MSSWKEKAREVIDGVELVTEERTDSRNHHGATEYIVTANIDGKFVTSRRVPWNVWLGHNFGSLLLPEIVEEAKRVKAREDTFDVVTELNLAGNEACRQADLVIAVCGDQSYIIKSRRDTLGQTHVTPRRPDTVIAYYPGSRDINDMARTEVLHFRRSGSAPKSAEPSEDGWIYTSDVPRPPHGGQVSVTFMMGNNGPFVTSARFDCGAWDFGNPHTNPAVEVIAWREHFQPAAPRLVTTER